ncbi:radical SAM protein [Candidatus Woesearchaeota archaeon]|jgi:FMN-dependent NADH-azoreductase|nr:radical SAM protein [Candidatus Woesearchaeota archaeon]
MIIPSNKNIVILNTPYTCIENYLCPNQIAIGILQLISFLKNKQNNVFFINMRSNDKHLWKIKPLGLNGKQKIQTHILGKNKKFLEYELKNIKKIPDEIWISCSFSCDFDVVNSMIQTCKFIFPRSIIKLGGTMARVTPNLESKLGVICFKKRIKGVELFKPDFQIQNKWSYGLFQLEVGCPNKCSFCISAMDKLKKIPIEFVINYMKEFYVKYNPKAFWNWDSNVLLFPDHLEKFLDMYIKSGMTSQLKFEMGFQPNLIHESLVKKMITAGVTTASLPFETASSKTITKYNKPYTIISSIKMTHLLKQEGFHIKDCECTFIIGHPDDEIKSIFRTFLSIIYFGGIPCPFPVFLFPGTQDYFNYNSLIKHKSYSELQGQLWPLISDENVQEYQNLFKFLSSKNLDQAKNNLSLLTDHNKQLFLEEIKKSSKFIKLCLDCPEDSINSLIKIETKLLTKNQNNIANNILWINTSPKKNSNSKNIAKELINQISCKKKSNTKIINLCSEKIEFINEDYIKHLTNSNNKKTNLNYLSDYYIKELVNCDMLILSTPMWSFSIPSILKAFFDLILIENKTFQLKPTIKGLLENKTIICILTRGGIYSKPPFNEFDLQKNYLQKIFEFMGVGTPKFLIIENLTNQPNSNQINEIQNKLQNIISEIKEHS